MRTVRITTDGAVHSTKIVDAVTGAEIKGVQRVEIDIDAGASTAIAKVKLWTPAFDGQAVAQFRMQHPKTGELTLVRSITFADCETVEF